MSIRRVKQYSDRGSIKDLHSNDEIYPPTDLELRLKQLYEHALETRDQSLSDSLGFITMNSHSIDPISVYRHREYIESLKDRLTINMEEAKQLTAAVCLMGVSEIPLVSFANSRQKQRDSTNVIHRAEEFVKTADANGNIIRSSLRVFWKVK